MSHNEGHAHKGPFSVRLGDRGRLVLPAEVRRRLSLEANDRLILFLDDDETLRIRSAKSVLRSAQGLFKRRHPGDRPIRLSDELIAERRREAARE